MPHSISVNGILEIFGIKNLPPNQVGLNNYGQFHTQGSMDLMNGCQQKLLLHLQLPIVVVTQNGNLKVKGVLLVEEYGKKTPMIVQTIGNQHILMISMSQIMMTA